MANYNLTQTGAEVQVILDRVAAGYIYMGTADLTTTPDTTNPNVCYLLSAVGTYTNFGNITHASGIGIALWNGTAWSYQNVPSAAVVATDAAVTENSANPVQSGGVYDELTITKEESLVSTYSYTNYYRNMHAQSGTIRTGNYVDLAVYTLLAGHTYTLSYNYSYSSTGATAGIVGYLNSATATAGDTYTPILNGDGLVEGWTTTITPSETKYIFIRWRADSTGNKYSPCVVMYEEYEDSVKIKDLADDLSYDTETISEITNDYLNIYDALRAYNNKFSAENYAKLSVYKLTNGVRYKFVYNFNYQSTNAYTAIIGMVTTPEDIAVGNYFRYIVSGDSLVSGFEYELTPNEDIYVFIRWHSDQSGQTYYPCVKVYEVQSESKSIKDVIGNLEDLQTEDKTSIVSAINSSIGNPLYGKKIALDGDSICYGAGFLGGYGKIIADRNNMSYQNLAVGGATIAAETYTSGNTARHWICRNISNLDQDADYIILEGGVNDTAGGTMTNTFNDTLNDTTFVGGCESMCKELLLRFPGKKIGFVIVHQVYGFTNFREADTKYKNLVAVLEKWGVPYCDLNVQAPAFGLLGGDLSDFIDTYTQNGDGWHPTEQGYLKYYCDKIESWMKTL